MTTGNRDYQANSAGERSVLSFIVALVLVPGCPSMPPPPTFDTEVFTTVVRDVYGDPEGTPTIFMDAEDLAKPDWDSLRTILERDLDAKVRSLDERQFDDALPPFTPVDPVTGERGVTVVLQRPDFDEVNDQVRIVASFVRFAGRERGCTEYVLAREGDDRPIIDRTDARPDCPIPEEVLESYEVALERAQSDECFGKWASIGACGPWLYVAETSGFDGTESYYDSQTGLIVAQARFTDTGPVFDRFVFGRVDCEPTETETILCNR